MPSKIKERLPFGAAPKGFDTERRQITRWLKKLVPLFGMSHLEWTWALQPYIGDDDTDVAYVAGMMGGGHETLDVSVAFNMRMFRDTAHHREDEEPAEVVVHEVVHATIEEYLMTHVNQLLGLVDDEGVKERIRNAEERLTRVFTRAFMDTGFMS